MATAADVLCVMLAVFFTGQKPKQERNKDCGLIVVCVMKREIWAV